MSPQEIYDLNREVGEIRTIVERLEGKVDEIAGLKTQVALLEADAERRRGGVASFGRARSERWALCL